MDPVVISHYEAVIIYAQEIKLMWQAGLDYNNGSLLTSRMRGSSYKSLIGQLHIGKDGIRARDYDLNFFNHDRGKFEVVLISRKVSALTFWVSNL